MAQRRFGYTLLGLLALPLWGSTFALGRSVSEQLGGLATAALTHGLAAGVSASIFYSQPGAWRRLRELPWRFWLLAGGCFSLYAPLLYLALDWAENRQQVLEVSLVNYLWPSLTLLFSLPILGRRAKPWLWLGLGTALAGIIWARTGQQGMSLATLEANLRQSPGPYLLAAGAAAAWALYSNFTRRYAGDSKAQTIPVLLLMTALLSALMLLVTQGVPRAIRLDWSGRLWAELLFAAMVPILAANLFWDLAMRHGHAVLVASAAQLTPLLAILITSLYLGVEIGPGVGIGCVLVTAGAAVCRFSIMEKPAPTRSAAR